MKGLIIKEKWLDKIFYENKIWEIRGSNTKIRGKIFLIQSGTKKIFGECVITNCIKLSLEEFKCNVDKHKIDENIETLPYKHTYAWILSNAKRYDTPIPYNHPNGAVIWVNITK